MKITDWIVHRLKMFLDIQSPSGSPEQKIKEAKMIGEAFARGIEQGMEAKDDQRGV